MTTIDVERNYLLWPARINKRLIPFGIERFHRCLCSSFALHAAKCIHILLLMKFAERYLINFSSTASKKPSLLALLHERFFRLRESTRYSVTRVGENSGRGLALLMPNPLVNLSLARLNYSRRRRNARLAALVIYKRLPEAPSVAWAQFIKVHDRI